MEPAALPETDKEKTMKTKILVQATAVAALAASLTPKAETAATQRGSCASAPVVIDTRSRHVEPAPGTLIETRSCEATGQAIPKIDTKSPLGTVIMLM